MRGSWRRRWVWTLCLCCGCADDARSGAATANAGSAAPPAVSAQPSSAAPIVIRFDGEDIATVEASAIADRAPLASLLPESHKDTTKWRSLKAASADGKRTLDVRRLADDYAELDVMLYVDEKHGPSVGLFRRLGDRQVPAHVRKAASKPHLRLVGAAFVEVRTKEVPVAAEPEQSPLVLTLGGKTRTLKPADLAKLKMRAPPELEDVAQPKRKRRRTREGWALGELIGTLAKPGAVAYVVASGRGKTLRLDGPWDDEKRVAIVRRTRRGRLEVALWSASKAEPDERLKNVTTLELFPAPSK